MTANNSTSKNFGLNVKAYSRTSKPQQWFKVEGSTKKPSSSFLKRVIKIEVRESSAEMQKKTNKDKYLLIFLKEGIASATLDFKACKKLEVGDLIEPSSLRKFDLAKVDEETGEEKVITVFTGEAIEED